MQVHVETLKLVSTETHQPKVGAAFTIERYTVEATINGDRRAIPCRPVAERGLINLFGLAVRFGHGAKVWPGSATYWTESNRVNNLRPDIDKRGNFQLVGFAEDYEGKAVRSQHNAVA